MNNIQMPMSNPFGPMIGHVKLPEQLVTDFNNACDNGTANKDHSKFLAGKVEQEITIPNYLFTKYAEYWDMVIKKYLQNVVSSRRMPPRYYSPGTTIGIQEGWFVRSFAGDYNPLHIHWNSIVSCVGYLKLPDWNQELQKEKSSEKENKDIGKIIFNYGNSQELSQNTAIITPKVGECHIFPSVLSHAVYPFKSDGERRSFSINFGLIQ